MKTWEVQFKKERLHRPGIEPGPPAWQASILPLNQRCLHLEVEVMSTYSWGEKTKNLEHVFENLRKSRVLRMQKLICFEMLTFVREQIGILARTCMFPRCSSCRELFCSFRGLPFPQFWWWGPRFWRRPPRPSEPWTGPERRRLWRNHYQPH